MVALLAAVAIALTGHPTLNFTCGALPPSVSMAYPNAIGAGGGNSIWILPKYCRQAYREEHLGLTTLAHEILHIRHDPWCNVRGIPYETCHEWIHTWDDWYAEHVVRWKIERFKAHLQ